MAEEINWGNMDELNKDDGPTNPTDVLIKAMEEAENMEDVIVVYTGKDGLIYYKSNTDSLAVRVGMLTIVNEHLKSSTFDMDGDYDGD